MQSVWPTLSAMYPGKHGIQVPFFVAVPLGHGKHAANPAKE